MEQKIILLVEDNRDDVALTLYAFKKINIRNQVVVAGTGAMALDYLFATGAFMGRDPLVLPELVLLDLHLLEWVALKSCGAFDKTGGQKRFRSLSLSPQSTTGPVSKAFASGHTAISISQ